MVTQHNSLTGADLHVPKVHTASHTDGTDDIQDATAAQKGVATATQITKLDGIEALADVTDGANVEGAGAVMESDASIAFDTITEKTADAGVTIDGALIKDNSYKTSNIHLNTNNLNEYATNAAASLNINYAGYDGGVTQDRNLQIYDGKQNYVALFYGSSKIVDLYGSLKTDTINEHAGAAGVTVDGVLIKDGGISATRTNGGKIAHFGGNTGTRSALTAAVQIFDSRSTTDNSPWSSGLIIQGGNNANQTAPLLHLFSYAASPQKGLVIDHSASGNAVECNGVVDLSGSLKSDTITEHTVDAGVTIDGVKCIDSHIQTPSKTPATSGAAGTVGEMCWDASYVYVCTATNTWKRSAISTW